MNLVALPAFADNYIWMLHDGTQAVVVDPGDELPVLQALEQASLTLCGILVTHHHPDHTGGVMALRERFAGVPLWTPANERLPVPGAADAAVHPVRGGDSIRTLGLEIAPGRIGISSVMADGAAARAGAGPARPGRRARALRCRLEHNLYWR